MSRPRSETAVMRGDALIQSDPWKGTEGSLEPLDLVIYLAGW